MSKLDDLTEILAEVADEEGLSEADLKALTERVAAARAARADPDRAPLARRDSDELAEVSEHEQRGVRMYGRESAAQAHARWREQEEQDADGIYQPGGATAGGIFGNVPIAMSDYDPAARAAGSRHQSQRSQEVIVELAERLIRKLDAMPAAPPPAAPQLEPRRGARGALDRLLKGRRR